jgi:hypothetical protein
MPELPPGNALQFQPRDHSIQQAFRQAVRNYCVRPDKPNADQLEEMTRVLRHLHAVEVWRNPLTKPESDSCEAAP